MMATAVVDNLISRNPCQDKGAGVERAPEMRIIIPEQVAGIAAAIERRYRGLVLTAAYAGCRWGELAGLRQKNLDLADGTLWSSSRWPSCMWPSARTGAEVGRRQARGPPPAGLVAELRSHVSEFVRPDPEGLVFTSGRGTFAPEQPPRPPLAVGSAGRRRGAAALP